MDSAPGVDRAGRKKAALAVALMALAAGGLAGWAMARRVSDFNDRFGRELYVYQPVDARDFEFEGRAVSIRDEGVSTPAERVVVAWGDQRLELRPGVPPGSDQLPGLVRHEDWMRVLRFAPRRGVEFADLQELIARGEVRDRLVIATRTPRPGADPATWGQVWRRDWVFDFYELAESGEIAHERLGYPTTRRGDPPKPGELAEGTWQFDAALLLMPPVNRPTPRFSSDAIGAMGWTLPATSLSILVSIVATAVALAPAKRRR